MDHNLIDLIVMIAAFSILCVAIGVIALVVFLMSKEKKKEAAERSSFSLDRSYETDNEEP